MVFLPSLGTKYKSSGTLKSVTGLVVLRFLLCILRLLPQLYQDPGRIIFLPFGLLK